nr:SDR family NAD(P)-dependent oxidoreductase [Desulfobacterales bacterium]
MRLKNKVSIITGAGAGIGKATALRFGQEGAKVVVADLDDAAGQEAVRQIKEAGGEATFVHTDVSRSEDCRLLMEESTKAFGRIDILVNNAGIYVQGGITDTSEEDWKRILAVNLDGVFYCSRHAVPYMIKAGGGSIVHVASEAGIVGIKNQLAYNPYSGKVLTKPPFLGDL